MSKHKLSPARLEAFSDGVIAVIITIMVLELKVPEHDGWAGVQAVMPTVLLYLLSFVQVGIYWVNHHYMLSETESVSHLTLWSNLIFLFSLSLFPFATAWAGEKHLSSFATALYAVVSLLPAGSYTVLWTSIQARSAKKASMTMSKMATSITLYVLAIPAAFVKPMLSLAMLAAVAVIWIMPPEQRRVEDGSHAE